MSQYLLTITESESGEMIFSESCDANDPTQRSLVLAGAKQAMMEQESDTVTGANLREGDIVITMTGSVLVGRILDSQTTSSDRTFILAEVDEGRRITTFEADRFYPIRPRTEDSA